MAKWIKHIKFKYADRVSYFDKMETIRKYIDEVSADQRKQDMSCEEMYEEALKYFDKQDFLKNTKDVDVDIFPISKDQGIIAVLIGIMAYGIAFEVDEHGGNIEHAIDKALPKDFDVNNAFDLRKGHGHRIFGHDIPAFGLKTIPAKSVVHAKSIETGKTIPMYLYELLGVDPDTKVSMWDIIWEFYGDDSNKFRGISNCLEHTIVHFAKDIFTPNGLPLPFVSLFNKYEEFNAGVALQYKDSLYKQLDEMHLNMKASDFASFALIESFIKFYFLDQNIKDSNDLLKIEMKLLAMATCMSLQMGKAVMSNQMQIDKNGFAPIVSGANTNLLMISTFMKLSIQEFQKITMIRKQINMKYDEM